MKLSDKPRQLGVAFAQNGTKNTVPAQSSQSTKEKGIATYDSGFPPITMTAIAAGGIPPQGNDFNGVLNDITAAIRYGQAGSLYTFDATFAAAIGGYPSGALVLSTGANKIWWNTVDGNATDPDSAQAEGWRRLTDRDVTWLESAKNLSDVQNKNAALQNLGAVAKTGDTMSGPLAVPRLVYPDSGSTDGDNDLRRPDGFVLESLADRSKNYPLTRGKLGNLITFKLNGYRHVQFAIGSGNTEFWLRSPREDDSATLKNWAQVYTTQYRPTAADVGAVSKSGDTMTGKLTLPQTSAFGINTGNELGGSSIVLGDSDTGLKQNGDGKLDVYANNQQVFRFEQGSVTNFREQAYYSPGAPVGSGAFADQLTNATAPFVQKSWNWTPGNGGHFVPLVKGLSNRTNIGYPSAVSFGYLLTDNNGFAIPAIHVRGDNSFDALWQFNPNDKTLYCPGNVHAGGAVYQDNGNLSGSVWGGYLSDWLNNQFRSRDDNINNRATWDYVNNDNTPTTNAANRGAIDARIEWWCQARNPGDVGSYAMLSTEEDNVRPGAIREGLKYSDASENGDWETAPGKWRLMGAVSGSGASGGSTSIWLRIY